MRPTAAGRAAPGPAGFQPAKTPSCRLRKGARRLRPQEPGGARLQGERERSPCVAPLAAGKLLPGGVNLPSRPYRTAREKTHKIKNENCNYPLAKKEKI